MSKKNKGVSKANQANRKSKVKNFFSALKKYFFTDFTKKRLLHGQYLHY